MEEKNICLEYTLIKSEISLSAVLIIEAGKEDACDITHEL